MYNSEVSILKSLKRYIFLFLFFYRFHLHKTFAGFKAKKKLIDN